MRRPFSGSAGTGLAVLLLLASASGAGAQSWRTVAASRQRTGQKHLAVNVTYGAGRLQVAPADPGLLYKMDLRYDESTVEPVMEYSDGHLRIGTRGLDHGSRVTHGNTGGHLDLFLPRDLPMDLTMEFGAVKANVDLGGLSLSDLSLSTGASQSTMDVSEPNPVSLGRARLEVGAADFTARHLGNLDARRIDVHAGLGQLTLEFTGDWKRDADVSVHMGIGSLKLRFPRGLGVKLEKKSFLTSLDSQGLVKRGDAYYSTNWGEAKRRVTLDVDATVVDVDVQWVG